MPTKTTKKAAFKPLSDETMPYGGKRFRAPRYKNEFFGTQGSPIPAYIFDIDGTLQGYGQGAQKDVLAWAKKLYDADPDAVFLVVTARDHGSFGYTSSFNWLMRHFPYPFIGPFARPVDDPRYTTEFKRELAQSFEDIGLYQIMGAADDNKWVIKMWKQWAIDHFEDPADFDLLECSYGTYAGWREGLDTKGSSWSSYGKSYTASGTHKGERWVNGGMVNGKWEQGHWEAVTVDVKSAATSQWAKNDDEPGPGVVVDISNDPRWVHYLAQRTKAGAYLGLDPVVDLDEGDSREELEDIVAHDYNLTPAEIAAMSMEQLTDWAYSGETRELLLVNVNEWFVNKFTAQELNELTNKELQLLLDLSDADAETFVDGIWDRNHVFDSGGPDEAQGTPGDNRRMELEENVYAEYDDLTYAEIDKMGDEELVMLLSAADKLSNQGQAQFEFSVEDQTQPLDVAEILGDPGIVAGSPADQDQRIINKIYGEGVA